MKARAVLCDLMNCAYTQCILKQLNEELFICVYVYHVVRITGGDKREWIHLSRMQSALKNILRDTGKVHYQLTVQGYI